MALNPSIKEPFIFGLGKKKKKCGTQRYDGFTTFVLYGMFGIIGQITMRIKTGIQMSCKPLYWFPLFWAPPFSWLPAIEFYKNKKKVWIYLIIFIIIALIVMGLYYYWQYGDYIEEGLEMLEDDY